MKRIVILSGIILAVLSSCIETEPVSPIPEIEFQSLEIMLAQDSLGNIQPVGQLIFTFIDGDADIGQYPTDITVFVPDEENPNNDSILKQSWNPDNYNLFTIPYYKEDTSYFRIETDTNDFPPPWYNVWHNSKLDRVGQNKTVKGSITVQLFDLPLQYDTVRYDFYIVDRAGNKSNVETTSDVGTHVEEEPSNFGL